MPTVMAEDVLAQWAVDLEPNPTAGWRWVRSYAAPCPAHGVVVQNPTTAAVRVYTWPGAPPEALADSSALDTITVPPGSTVSVPTSAYVGVSIEAAGMVVGSARRVTVKAMASTVPAAGATPGETGVGETPWLDITIPAGSTYTETSPWGGTVNIQAVGGSIGLRIDQGFSGSLTGSCWGTIRLGADFAGYLSFNGDTNVDIDIGPGAGSGFMQFFSNTENSTLRVGRGATGTCQWGNLAQARQQVVTAGDQFTLVGSMSGNDVTIRAGHNCTFNAEQVATGLTVVMADGAGVDVGGGVPTGSVGNFNPVGAVYLEENAAWYAVVTGGDVYARCGRAAVVETISGAQLQGAASLDLGEGAFLALGSDNSSYPYAILMEAGAQASVAMSAQVHNASIHIGRAATVGSLTLVSGTGFDIRIGPGASVGTWYVAAPFRARIPPTYGAETLGTSSAPATGLWRAVLASGSVSVASGAAASYVDLPATTLRGRAVAIALWNALDVQISNTVVQAHASLAGAPADALYNLTTINQNVPAGAGAIMMYGEPTYPPITAGEVGYRLGWNFAAATSAAGDIYYEIWDLTDDEPAV